MDLAIIQRITHLEKFVTFCKTNTVAFARVLFISQPLIVVGNIGGTGRG